MNSKNTLTFLGYIAFLFCCFAIVSCTKTDDKPKPETSLIGTWQLIEVYDAYSGNPDSNWNPVENGHYYTFNEDGSMVSDRFICSNGLYEIETNESLEQRRILITFNCHNNQHQANLRMPPIGEFLILIDEISCDEGCAEKYIKIALE